MQRSFEVLFLLSVFVPVAAVVAGAVALFGATLRKWQRHAADAEASPHRGLHVEHLVGH